MENEKRTAQEAAQEFIEARKLVLSSLEPTVKQMKRKVDLIVSSTCGVPIEELHSKSPIEVLTIWLEWIDKHPIEELPTLPTEYVKMLNCPELNQFAKLNKNKINPVDNVGYYIGNRVKFAIENFNKGGALKTSANKLLDTAVCLLTAQVRMNSEPEEITPRCLCELDIEAYAELNGINLKPSGTGTPEEQEEELKRSKYRRKKFVNTIHEDLKALESVTWTSDTQHYNLRIISSHYSTRDGKIMITFDPATAYWLANNYLMKFPLKALQLDNKCGNAYAVIRKLAEHNNTNRNKKNSNTIGVKTLLEYAPEIMTFEEFAELNRRTWKKEIKERLENALKQCVDVGALKSWEYKNGEAALTSDQAGELSPNMYNRLMIDFEMYPDDDVLEIEANQKE